MTIPKFSRFTIFLAKVLLWVIVSIVCILIYTEPDARLYFFAVPVYWKRKEKEKEMSSTTETQVNQGAVAD